MGRARMLILHQPRRRVRDRMCAAVEGLGLAAVLGERLFPAHNWHQTLCGPFDAGEAALMALVAAGDAAQAAGLPAFVLRFNRIRGEQGERIHWAFLAQGRPPPFDALLQTLQEAVAQHALADGGHRPHVTISYDAPHALPTQRIAPIDCVVDELQLAERTGAGRDWRYHILHRWPLRAVPETAHRQLDLFEP